MHQSTRDYIEEFLRDPADPGIPREFHAHVATCSDCARQIDNFRIQTQLISALRADTRPEQAPGFYGRVLSRIDQPVRESFWSPFLEPDLARRLAYACGTLVLLLGTYLVSNADSMKDQVLTPSGIVPSVTTSAFDDGSVQPKQRDAVLVNLVTYQE